MRKTIALLGLLVAVALPVQPALAHHGWAAYDTGKPVKLAGTVTEVSYTYPHATIKLEVSGKTWLAVLAPPSRMSSRGLPHEDLKIGMLATVEGFPSKHDPAEMRAERIAVNGKVYELR